MRCSGGRSSAPHLHERVRCVDSQATELREQLPREGRLALPFASPTSSTEAPKHTSTLSTERLFQVIVYAQIYLDLSQDMAQLRWWSLVTHAQLEISPEADSGT